MKHFRLRSNYQHIPENKEVNVPVGSTSNAGKTGRGPIIEVKNLRKEYPVLDETVVALERVNLAIPQRRRSARGFAV